MTVTANGGLINILPTGMVDSPENYLAPKPLQQHMTFSFSSTEIFVTNLLNLDGSKCAFADFEGDVPYTTPTAINDYLITIFNV